MNEYSERLITIRKRDHAVSTETLSVFDRSGILISLLCLIHCAFTPALLFLWPALYEHTPGDDMLHIIFAVLVVLSGGYAFYRGYQAHRTAHIMWMAFWGFAFLLTGIFFHETAFTAGLTFGTVFTVVGSILLITAHIKNLHTCRHACSCKHSS